MSDTRRSFLRSTAALATGLAGGASLPAQGQGGRNPIASAPDSEIKVPKVKFGKVEISRLILGVNPFYGFGHYNQILGTVMKEWYTEGKVVEVLQRSEKLGINAFNYVHMSRGQPDWERYLAEGGKMHLIAQATMEDPTEFVKAVKCVFRAMPISVPNGCRSRFQTHAYHHSKVMAITVPKSCRSIFGRGRTVR